MSIFCIPWAQKKNCVLFRVGSSEPVCFMPESQWGMRSWMRSPSRFYSYTGIISQVVKPRCTYLSACSFPFKYNEIAVMFQNKVQFSKSPQLSRNLKLPISFSWRLWQHKHGMFSCFPLYESLHPQQFSCMLTPRPTFSLTVLPNQSVNCTAHWKEFLSHLILCDSNLWHFVHVCL